MKDVKAFIAFTEVFRIYGRMGFVKTFSAVQKIYFAQFETCIPCSVTWQSGFTFF